MSNLKTDMETAEFNFWNLNKDSRGQANSSAYRSGFPNSVCHIQFKQFWNNMKSSVKLSPMYSDPRKSHILGNSSFQNQY